MDHVGKTFKLSETLIGTLDGYEVMIWEGAAGTIEKQLPKFNYLLLKIEDPGSGSFVYAWVHVKLMELLGNLA